MWQCHGACSPAGRHRRTQRVSSHRVGGVQLVQLADDHLGGREQVGGRQVADLDLHADVAERESQHPDHRTVARVAIGDEGLVGADQLRVITEVHEAPVELTRIGIEGLLEHVVVLAVTLVDGHLDVAQRAIRVGVVVVGVACVTAQAPSTVLLAATADPVKLGNARDSARLALTEQRRRVAGDLESR